MKAFYLLSLAVSAVIEAPNNSPNELDARACCTVKICDGFELMGKCHTGCHPKIDEVLPDPISLQAPPCHRLLKEGKV
ncbi:hypothetical protein PG996_002666 [Apiospora saccharicola]|uniref:Uncharacterized protein n=1 Tax=Apiospora saccharicola TaxID=335842 RepID=A0ABR1WN29_9PEZI